MKGRETEREGWDLFLTGRGEARSQALKPAGCSNAASWTAMAALGVLHILRKPELEVRPKQLLMHWTEDTGVPHSSTVTVPNGSP